MLASARVISTVDLPVPPLAGMGLTGFEDFEKLDAAGITYHSHFFVRRGCERDESLHFHELVHVVQSQHLGFDRFIMAYALGHLFSGGYGTNPLEVVAYVLQGCFDQNAPGFDVAAVVRREMDELVPVLEARAAGAGL